MSRSGIVSVTFMEIKSNEWHFYKAEHYFCLFGFVKRFSS